MLFTSILMLLSPKAMAWDDHQVIMEQLSGSEAAKKRAYLAQKIKVPCPADETAELTKLGASLQIDAGKIPVFSKDRCKAGEKSTELKVGDLIASNFIDEPDQGMDQNLPASDDPKHFRKWMGGETGPTSQGFRHMYFRGVEWSAPLKTFQIPFGSLGESPERIKTLRNLSDEYFKKGDLFWGTRLLLWELHYVQDLHQPFHVLQVPSLRLLPWKKLFSGFIKAATHSIGNYHYAYEGLALEWAKDPQSTQFTDCFELQGENSALGDPENLVFSPRNLGGDLGPAIFRLFGNSLKHGDVDLPNDIGVLDYFEITHMSEPEALLPALNQIKQITCELMKSVTRYTWSELDRVYLGSGASKSTSSSTGK